MVIATNFQKLKRRFNHTLNSIDAQYTKESIEQCSLECLITQYVNCASFQYASEDNSCKLSTLPLVEASTVNKLTVFTYEGGQVIFSKLENVYQSYINGALFNFTVLLYFNLRISYITKFTCENYLKKTKIIIKVVRITFKQFNVAVIVNDVVETEDNELPLPIECQSAISLTEYWRHHEAGTGITPPGGTPCDTHDMINNYPEPPWFKFAGAAGNTMLDTCPPSRSCGAYGMWTDAEMPSAIGTAIEVPVYSSFQHGCKYKTISVLVMRCSTAAYDFVYKLNQVWTSCSFTFCGMSKS